MGGHYFEGWVGRVVEEVCCAEPFSVFQLVFVAIRCVKGASFVWKQSETLGWVGSISINRDITYPSPFSIRTSNSACRSIDPDWPSC